MPIIVPYQFFAPLRPPISKMPVWRGSKANSTRYGLPPCWTRKSFMFEKRDPFTVSTVGLPNDGPTSSSTSILLATAIRSALVSPANHSWNSSVASTSDLARNERSVPCHVRNITYRSYSVNWNRHVIDAPAKCLPKSGRGVADRSAREPHLHTLKV
jgi:hypothetical protein